MNILTTVAAWAVAMGTAVPATAQKTEYDRCCVNCSNTAAQNLAECTKMASDARQSCELRQHKALKACTNTCLEQRLYREQVAAKARQRAADDEAARKRRAALTPQ